MHWTDTCVQFVIWNFGIFFSAIFDVNIKCAHHTNLHLPDTNCKWKLTKTRRKKFENELIFLRIQNDQNKTKNELKKSYVQKVEHQTYISYQMQNE